MKTPATVIEKNDALQSLEIALELRAREDFRQHRGKALLVRVLTGYNDHDDSVEIICDPPARMRLCQTVNDDLRHWVDNWLDPYWDVEEVTPHPALKDIRSMWIFGPSYCTDGRTEPCSDWSVEKTTFAQALKDWVTR